MTHRTADTRSPERSPDRRPAYVRRNFYLLCACLTLLLFVAVGLAYGLLALHKVTWRGTATKGITGERRRDLAGKLLSAGVRQKAAEQYERYLEETDLPPERRANIAYTLGKLYMEEGRYEDALSWFYRVELIDPKSTLAPEVGSKIVACLERLGRFAQAEYSLEARSGPNGKGREEFKGKRVVARIGKDEITLGELDEAMDVMPEWMRTASEDPDKKEAFLRQYVAEELLYRKAKRLELDKDPVVRKRIERAVRELMVQKLLEDEVKAKVKVSEDDVELYFQAHRDRYGQKEAFRVRAIQVEADRLGPLRAALDEGQDFSELARRYSLNENTRENGGEVTGWIEEGLDPTGMGDPEALWKALSGHVEGETTDPVQKGDQYWIFQVTAHRAPRSRGLNEVRKQVESDLYRERVQKAYQDLIQQTLKASEVTLYPERLRDEPPSRSDVVSPGG